jgi:hypothetical protein
MAPYPTAFNSFTAFMTARFYCSRRNTRGHRPRPQKRFGDFRKGLPQKAQKHLEGDLLGGNENLSRKDDHSDDHSLGKMTILRGERQFFGKDGYSPGRKTILWER